MSRSSSSRLLLLLPLILIGACAVSSMNSSNKSGLFGLFKRSVCDMELLSQAGSPEQVEAACKVPEDLTLSWTCEAAPPAAAEISGLRQLHQDCGLEALGTQEAFATGSGDPLRGALLYTWLKNEEVELAAEAARILVGEPPFEGDVVLPPMPGAPVTELVSAQTIASELRGSGVHGPYPGWKLESVQGAAAVVFDEKLSVQTVRHALVSLGSDKEPLRITGAASGVTQLSLHLPSSLPEATRMRIVDGALQQAADGDGSKPAEILLEIEDSATVAELTTVMASLHGSRLGIALDYAPCETPPEGMVCVPGGGPDKLPTFYVDTATSNQVEACEDAGTCRSKRSSWHWAREYCSWQGKRLPTSFEFSAATAAAVFEPGETEQWLANWEGDGPAPHGTCGGAPRCKKAKKRLLSNGEAASPRARKATDIRCASSNSWLATYPPLLRLGVENQPPAPVPNPELAALAAAIDMDDIMKTGICGESVREHWGEERAKGGRSTTSCRDPLSYLTSNEPRRYIWADYFTNLGGGYLGVGSDQNYDFIAAARSEWAWIFDYDPNVVRLHGVLRELIKASPTRQEFVARFGKGEAKKSAELIVAATEDPKRARVLERFYYGHRRHLERHYTKSLKPLRGSKNFGWLSSDANYEYIRTLYMQGRIVPIAANMWKDKSFRSVAKTAREMGVPIRIYYSSNAPTAWGGHIPPDYRTNVLALPFDDQSVVLGTFNWGGFDQKGYWHYNVMNGLLFQERMSLPGFKTNSSREGPPWDRIPGEDSDLTLCGLRGAPR